MNTSNDRLGASTRVLIVDDNSQYSQLLSRILANGFGYESISVVGNTDEAYEIISSDPEKFGLLFIDYRFPNGLNGGGLLRKLKDSKLLSDKVAFLITSEPTLDNQREALLSGARGVVAKPFDRHSIKAQLEKAKRALETESGEGF